MSDEALAQPALAEDWSILLGSPFGDHACNCDDPDLMCRFLDGHDGKYPYLPKEGLLFPELLQPEPASERPTVMTNASCAELVMEGSQHLLVKVTREPFTDTFCGLQVSRLHLALHPSTENDLHNPDKDVLRQTILDLRAQGMSYRQIAELVGLHWTRVGQIAQMESR